MPTFPITAVVPRLQYTASSLQTTFAYTWPIFTDEDIAVYLTPNGQNPSESTDLLLLNIGYTVTGAGTANGGSIVLITPATAGDTITLQRNISLERLTNYSNGNAINADALNADFDRIIMMIQDLNVYLQKINTRYQIPDVIPNLQIILPQLPAGWYWQGGPNDTVIAVEAEENPDASTLRTELANNDSSESCGANLVGYFDEDTGPTTVRLELDNLKNSLNTHVLSILDFGGDPTGNTNTTPALNAAYTYCAANDIGTLWFPRGQYLFTTQPNNTPQLMRIRGDGVSLVTILRDFTPASPIGIFSAIDHGLLIGGMSFLAQTGTSGGSAVYIKADNTDIEYQVSVEDLAIISNGGTWAYDILVTGDNTNTIGYGIIDKCNISGADTANLLLQNINNFSVSVDTQQDGGAVNVVTITGDATRPSNNLNVNIGQLINLSLDYCENSLINCTNLTNLTNTVNTDSITVYGSISGTKETDWSNSRYITNNDFLGTTSSNGYQKFPNGLIIQWAELEITQVFTDIALPIPFPNENWGVFSYIFISEVEDTVTVVNDKTNNTLSTVHLTYESGSLSGPHTFNVIAIGR